MHLDSRLLEVLLSLAERAGEVVTRDELHESAWGRRVFVSENTISQAVSRLRRALGDDWREPRYIETVNRTGYRLLASPQPLPEAAASGAASPIPPAETPHPAGGPRRGLALAGVAAASATVLLVLTATDFLPSPGGHSTPQFVEPVPAITLVGREQGPRLSPDGRRIVFAWAGERTEDAADIWVKEIETGNLVQITDSDAGDIRPAWTPDGLSISYARVQPGGECALFLRPLIGGPPVRLAACTERISGMAWSPDARLLVFGDQMRPEDDARLFMLDTVSGERRLLTTPAPGMDHRDPVFSPDGRRVAFRRSRGLSSDDLMVVPARGGTPTKVNPDTGIRIRGHDWLPGGDELIYSADRNGRFDLWIIGAAGPSAGSPRRLVTSDQWIYTPTTARSMRRLTYKRYNDVVDLFRVPLRAPLQSPSSDGDPLPAAAPAEGAGAAVPAQFASAGTAGGGGASPLPGAVAARVASSTRTESHPHVSPDGKRLAFVSDRSGSQELWSGDLDGGNLRRHTSFGTSIVAAPRWSPDGATLLFDADPDGQRDLYAVAADGRRPRRITRDAGEDRSGSFSHDGRWIYFGSNRSGSWEIWRIPADGGNAAQVTREGGLRALEGPDGTDLYYTKRSDARIWKRPLGGGPETPLVEDLHPYDWASWEVGRRGIYYVRREPAVLVCFVFATRATEVLHVPDGNISFATPSFGLLPGESGLVFAQVRSFEDEVMRVDL